jgi:hypothetical protein
VTGARWSAVWPRGRSALPAGTVAGVRVGCFPDVYAALAGDPPDLVITL